MAKSGLAGKAQTVLGPIDAAQIGIAVTHEHLLIDFRVVFVPPTSEEGKALSKQPISMSNLGWVRYNWASSLENLRYEDEALAAREAAHYARAGGRTVVDATSIGLKRNPRALANISKAAGINVIMGSGYYVQASHPQGFHARTVEDIAAEIERDITIGADGTAIKSGIIGEIGCSWPWTRDEKKSMQAAIIAQARTGAPLLIHPGRSETAPIEIVNFIVKNGGNLRRTIMGHIERTIFTAPVLDELAATGIYLEYDLFGHDSSYYPFAPQTYMPNDAQRLEQIDRLIANGHLDQILLAHDVCSRHRLKEFGGHGLDHIPARVAPWMKARGLSQVQVDRMLVDNPARVLAFV